MPSPGWGNYVKSETSEIFHDMDQLMYEVRNCVRGSYTKCETVGELSDYLDELADKIHFTAMCLRDNLDEAEEDM